MNRRTFLSSSIAVAMLPETMLSGCAITDAELQADATALATALTNLATVVQATDPATATALTTAAQGLAAAAQAATGGSAWQEALNAAAAGVEVVLGAIPTTAPFAALVAIAVAAAETLIANTKASAGAVTARIQANSANLSWYRDVGQVILKHRFGRSPAGDFKAAWKIEAVVFGHPEIEVK